MTILDAGSRGCAAMGDRGWQPTELLKECLQELTMLAAGPPGHQLACAVTVRVDERRPYTIASSDGLAERLDEAQYAADTGPCLHALREAVTVDVPDMAGERRWPEFQRQALDAGIAASISIPMIGCGATVGAVKLYARTPLGEDERRRAQHFSNIVGGAVGLVVQLSQQRRLTDNLQTALTSRATIDQAMGVIMGQQRCSAEEAFALLSRASQNRNAKLRDIAAGIVTRITTGQKSEFSPPVLGEPG